MTPSCNDNARLRNLKSLSYGKHSSPMRSRQAISTISACGRRFRHSKVIALSPSKRSVLFGWEINPGCKYRLEGVEGHRFTPRVSCRVVPHASRCRRDSRGRGAPSWAVITQTNSGPQTAATDTQFTVHTAGDLPPTNAVRATR